MNIKYLGHSSFLIKSRDGRVLMDPYDPAMVGIKLPKIETDVVTISHGHGDHNYHEAASGEPLLIDWPGEYEKKSIRIQGFATYHDEEKGAQRGENILFKINTEDVSILHCGDLGHTLSDTLLESIGDIDILMIPVGGHYTIDAKQAVAVIKQIEPTIIIPMHYRSEQHDQEKFGVIAPLEDFLKAYGVETVEPIDQLNIKAEELGEETRLIVMKTN